MTQRKSCPQLTDASRGAMGRTMKGLLISKYAGLDLIRVACFPAYIQLLFIYYKTNLTEVQRFLMSLSCNRVVQLSTQ